MSKLSELAGDEPADDESPLNGLSVVLVEDDDAFRGLLTHILEYYGADVYAAASAGEAIEVLERRHADVMVSDLQLPAQDGFWLIRELRARTDLAARSIPAASITASGRIGDRHRALAAGYQSHLEMPFDPKDLVGAVLMLATTSLRDRSGPHRDCR